MIARLRFAVSCAALVLALAAAPAAAAKVAVLSIAGSDGSLEAEVEKALAGQTLVKPLDWDAAAAKIVATSHSAEDIAAVARELSVDVVVTGNVKHEENGWILIVAVRNGPTGQRIDRLTYKLASAEIDAATQQTAANEIAKSVVRATGGASAPPPANNPPANNPPANNPPANNPPANNPPPATGNQPSGNSNAVVATAPEKPSGRPPWAPYFDVSIGTIVSGRGFLFDGQPQPFFASTVAEGLHLDGTVYPLAGRAAFGGRGNGALSGLGLGVTFDGVFWPDAVPCVKDASGNCMATNQKFGVHELRYELGPRWKWNVIMAPDTVEILASIQFGQHSLSVDKLPDGRDLGAPDVTYSYLTLGLGLRLPLAHAFALFGHFNYHALFGTGPISLSTEYGAGGGYGLRAGGGIELTLWEGITVRFDGFYERFGLGFDGTGMPAKSGMNAVDQYYGAIASLGWVDHRAIPNTAPADRDGDGILDADDKCPDQPGPATTHGCPDGDKDGVADKDDKCPALVGTVENHGCPADSDKDGVADIDDQCPSVPGDPANKGCPVYKAVKVTNDRIELSEKIFFAFDKTEILPKSDGLLDEVVKALSDHANLRVKILGHTDSSGTEKHNQELSEGRAGAVRDYLVSHGIDAARIVEARGYGSSQPIDTNKTLEGRENNRRVEFLIVKE
jgi:outer membrane protein OmpA-like peptidoglycan-associated protein